MSPAKKSKPRRRRPSRRRATPRATRQPPPAQGVATRASRWQAPALALAAALLAGLVYVNALENPFVYDDHRTVVTNPTLRDPGNVRALLAWERFRPLVNLTYAVDYAVWELRPLGYHLTSVALHAVHVVLFFVAARVLFGDRRRLLPRPTADPAWPAFACAALFAVHPLMTEAVGYVSGRSEVLCGIFFLTAFLAVRGFLLRGGAWRLAAGLAAFVLAVAAKEVGAMFPFVMALYDVLLLGGTGEERRRRLRRFHLPFVSLVLVAGGLRLWLFFRLEAADAPRAVWQHLMSEWEVVWRYLGLLVLPFGQTIAHPVRTVATPWEPGAWLAGAGLLLAAAAAVALCRRDPLVSLGVAWFLLLLAPSSTVIPIAELMSEHRVYAASCGVFLAVVALAGRLFAGLRGASACLVPGAVLVAVLAVLAVATLARNRIWADPVRLWGEAADKTPLTWRAAYGLGSALYQEGRCKAAVPVFREAARLLPRHLDSRMNLGICLAQLERYGEARAAFTAALEIDPHFVKAYNNLGRLSFLGGQVDVAESYFSRALEEDPDNVLARLNLIHVYQATGRSRGEIRRLCEEVAALDPQAPGIADCLR